MNNDNLSLENMVEFAMGLSMTTLFNKAMSSSYDTLNSILNQNNAPVPPRYIYAVLDGKQQGPFSLGEVMHLIREGAIKEHTYIWKQGMIDWKQAKDVDDLSPELKAIPPTLP